MSNRVCLEPGCPKLIKQGQGRCATHRSQREHERGSSTARGYGYDHQGLRAKWQARLDSGEPINCWRCGTRIDPTYWQLGHDDHDRSKYRGPECVPCNTATAGRR